jgi:hypothetical protein
MLRSWRTNAPLPPRFAEGVWKRIERADAAGPATLWTMVQNRIVEAFARPSLAMAYVTLLLLFGVAAGYWQGRLESQRTEAKLSAQYVQAVDPYQRLDHR